MLVVSTVLMLQISMWTDWSCDVVWHRKWLTDVRWWSGLRSTFMCRLSPVFTVCSLLHLSQWKLPVRSADYMLVMYVSAKEPQMCCRFCHPKHNWRLKISAGFMLTNVLVSNSVTDLTDVSPLYLSRHLPLQTYCTHVTHTFSEEVNCSSWNRWACCDDWQRGRKTTANKHQQRESERIHNADGQMELRGGCESLDVLRHFHHVHV